MPNTTMISLFVDDETLARLREHKERTGVSFSETIRRALRAWLDKEQESKPEK